MFGCNFSLLNYDAIGGGIFGSMRLGFNQAMMHANVYPSLFTYPTMNFGSFTPYQQFTNSNWLLDPGFALQSTFSNMQNYGYFGAGMMQPIQQTAWPWAGASIGGSTKTAEEKAQEKELNNLKAVAKEVVAKLSGDSKTTLQTAIDKKDGTVAEKITALENALKADGVKTHVENVLLNNPPSGIKVGSKTLASILKGDGVHLIYGETLDSKIDDMNKKAEDGDKITKDDVTNLNIGKNNVLEFIEGLTNFDYIKDKNRELFNELNDSLNQLAAEVVDNSEINDNLKAKVKDYRGKENPTLDDFKNLYAAVLLAVSELADRKLEEATGNALDGIVADKFYTSKAINLLKTKGVSDNIITSIQATPVTPGQESGVYTPSADNIVTIEFGRQNSCQQAHNNAAIVLAEAVEKIGSKGLSFEYVTNNSVSVNNQIIAKLENGNYVQIVYDDNGEITNIYVSTDNIGGAEILYSIAEDGKYVAAPRNPNSDPEFAQKYNISESDFNKLTDKCQLLLNASKEYELRDGIHLNLSGEFQELEENLNLFVDKLSELRVSCQELEGELCYVASVEGKRIYILVSDDGSLEVAVDGDTNCEHLDFNVNLKESIVYNNETGVEVNVNAMAKIKILIDLIMARYKTTQAS